MIVMMIVTIRMMMMMTMVIMTLMMRTMVIVAAMSCTFTVISFSTLCSYCMNCNCLDHASFMQYEHSVETDMTVKVQLMAVMKIKSNKPPRKLSY